MYAKIIGLVLLMAAPAWAQLAVPGSSTNTPGMEITVTNLVFGDGSSMQSTAAFTNSDFATNYIPKDFKYGGFGHGVSADIWSFIVGSGSTGTLGATVFGPGNLGKGQSAVAVGKLNKVGSRGVGVGYGLELGTHGVGLGYLAKAVEDSAAIGYLVENTTTNSTQIRGNLYLDGGEAVYYRSGFGTGTWTLIAAAGTDVVPYVETDPVWLAASTNYTPIVDFEGCWTTQRLTNVGLQASIATNAYGVALKLSTADWEASDPYTNYVRRTGDTLSGGLTYGYVALGASNVTYTHSGSEALESVRRAGLFFRNTNEVATMLRGGDHPTGNGGDVVIEGGQASYGSAAGRGGDVTIRPGLRVLGALRDGDIFFCTPSNGIAYSLRHTNNYRLAGDGALLTNFAAANIAAGGVFSAGDAGALTNADPSSFAVDKVYAAGDGSAITNITGLVSSNYLDKAGGVISGPVTNLAATWLVGPVSEGSGVASVDYSHSEGEETAASGTHSAHAEGYQTIASGDYGSHAEGSGAHAIGAPGAHAEGNSTLASGTYGAHAEGNYSVASGNFGAHAEGNYTIASGTYGAHAAGSESIAAGETSFALGYRAVALDDFSFVWSDYSAGSASNYSTGPGTFNVYATNGIRLFGGAYYGDGRGLTNLATVYLTIASFNATLTNYFKYVNEAPTSNSMPTVGRQIRPLTLGSTNGLAFYIPEYCDKWMFVPAHTNW